LRLLLLRHAHSGAEDVYEQIQQAAPEALDALMARPHVQIAPPVRNRADAELAEFCVAEALANLQAARGAAREIEEAMEDIAGLVDEGLTWRLSQANDARFSALAGPKGKAVEAVVAPNGVQMNKEELDGARSLWDSIQYSRGGRKD
jgi:DNA primase